MGETGKTYETTIKLGAELSKDFGKKLGWAEKRLAALGKSAAELKKTAGAAKAFDRLGSEVAEAEKKFAAARAEVDKLGAEMKATEKPSDELTASFKAAKKAASESERALIRKSKALDRAGDKLKTAGVDSKRLAEEQKRLARTIRSTELRMAGLSKMASAKLGTNLRKLGGELKTVGLAAGAVLAGGLYKAADAAMAEEDALAKLASLPGVSDEQVKAIYESARAWSVLHKQSAPEFLATAYDTISAGITETGASIAATEQAMKLATVTFADGNTAMQKLADLYENFGDKAKPASEELERFSDILTLTQQKFKIEDLAQLGDGLKYGLSQAIAFNAPVSQTAAIIGKLNDRGRDGSKAGTSFAATLVKLSSAAKKMKVPLKQTADGQLDVLGSIEAVNAAVDKQVAKSKGKKSRGDILQTLFGQEGAGLPALLAKDIDALRAFDTQLRTTTHATETAFDGLDATTSTALQAVKNDFTNTMADVGKSLLPVIKEHLPDIKEAIKALPGVFRELFAIGKEIAAFIDSIGGIKTVLAGLAAIKLYGVGKELFGVAGSVVKLAGGLDKWASSLPGLAGQIGHVGGVISVGALAVGAWGLAISNAIDAYKEWQSLKDANARNERIDAGGAKLGASLAARHGRATTGGTAGTRAALDAFQGTMIAGKATAERKRLQDELRGRGVDVSQYRGNLEKLRAAAGAGGGAGGQGAQIINFKPQITVLGGGPTTRADAEAGVKAGAADLEKKLHDEKRRALK